MEKLVQYDRNNERAFLYGKISSEKGSEIMTTCECTCDCACNCGFCVYNASSGLELKSGESSKLIDTLLKDDRKL